MSLRLSHALRRRISYLSDVEGDFHYFREFVAISKVIRWRDCQSSTIPEWNGGTSLNGDTTQIIDLDRYTLDFQDSSSHFVFGGDAFDHGADLTFARALLDFQARYPSRVHLLIGNRDANKIVMSPLMDECVDGVDPDAAEELLFPASCRPAAATAAAPRYRDFLAQCHSNQESPLQASGTAVSPVAEKVSFLQWALQYKLGSPNAFEHRRRELAALRQLKDQVGDPKSSGGGSSGGAELSDETVAQSFFSAAQPGGVYREYLRHGKLSIVLDGTLFVHGGVNASNAGFVPSLDATTHSEQMKRGRHSLPHLTAAGESPSPFSTSAGAETPGQRPLSALEWLDALNDFKEASVAEWMSGTGLRGEALRSYVYPRGVAPYSIAVGSVVDADGPHPLPLPVAAYLLESGLHTVVSGHQPTGDTAAVVRQPGELLQISADNSYCGRRGPHCTPWNRRGLAVMEVLIDTGDTASLILHGRRADGAEFHFDVLADHRIGQYVGDGWWVKVGPNKLTASPSDLYELHRTANGFFDEEVESVTASVLDERLNARMAQGPLCGGELPDRYTKEELAEQRVHRVKTKVVPKLS